jgi:hypothetical protein
VSGVDQFYFNSLSFQDLIQGNPIDPGRFHDYSLNAAFSQPIRHGVQISCKAFEAANRLLISVFGYRNPVFFRTHIDPCRIGINDREGFTLRFSGAFFSLFLILLVPLLAHSVYISLLGVRRWFALWPGSVPFTLS